nr:hypothetical protein [Spiroplasma chinense]
MLIRNGTIYIPIRKIAKNINVNTFWSSTILSIANLRHIKEIKPKVIAIIKPVIQE